ncbi:unnamed protein product [Mytilus coruscus]|uniref:Mab-21-like HhH/H2TH-like domain-containing protein n=2 Tax=Mytilus coruscus TaxID=42192 RepID=A0A6J7ZVF8_MYTCO|nr:unnamed protein product [Mytilus coruscus]
MSVEIIYSRTNENLKSENVNETFLDKSVIHSLSDSVEASEVISAILGADHVNSEELALYRQWTFIFECSCKYVINMDSFAAGSRIDCSASPESDEDQMIQMKDIEVISNVDDVTIAGTKLIIDTSNSPSGFTLLHPYTLSVNVNRHETKGCLQSCVELESGLYLSSERYIQYNMELIADMDKYSPPSFHAGESMRHGPCVMLNYGKHGKDSDMAIGLKCSSWPTESLEWVTRIRKSNWPDQQLVNKIKQMPCHVLPVGHPESDKCDLEWRFAYVLPERELIWNFNDVQIQCYVIFKTLIKELLDPIAPEEINSFHLKTILLWLSEEIDDWTPKRLIDYVKKCLDHLYKAIAEGHLSHYFFKSRNLFLGKLQNETMRARLQSKILRLQKNVISLFLQCNWQYKRGGQFLSTIRLVDHNLSEKEVWTVGRGILQQGQDKFKRNKYSHARCLSMEVALSIMYLPVTYENLIKVIEEIGEELKENLMSIYALKFLSIRLGMLLLAEAKHTPDREKRQHLGSEAKGFFEIGFEHDILASCMYSLTYYYQTRNYNTIKKFLNELFGRRLAIRYEGTPGLINCGSRALISPDMYEEVSEKDIANENDIAFDAIFSCSDILCVPPAMQLECALLDGHSNWCFCSIHPLVYASYMQFQVASNLGDVDERNMSIDHLLKMVKYIEGGECGGLVDYHRHYNILGYCYFIINDFKNALKWFGKSLQICPTSGNAAVYQLCIMISSIGTIR